MRQIQYEFDSYTLNECHEAACRKFNIGGSGVRTINLTIPAVSDEFIKDFYRYVTGSGSYDDLDYLVKNLEEDGVDITADELLKAIATTGQIKDKYGRNSKLSKFHINVSHYEDMREPLRIVKPYKLKFQIGVRSRDFAQIGHYGPDNGSCFREGGCNELTPFYMFRNKDTAVVLSFHEDTLIGRSLLLRKRDNVYFTNNYIRRGFMSQYGFPYAWIGYLLCNKVFDKAELGKGDSIMDERFDYYINRDRIHFRVT